MNNLSVKDRLDSFRARFAGCSAVVFADLSTGMVLSTSTREKTTQEKLDELCQQAASCLNGQTAIGVSDVISGRGCLVQSAFRFSATHRFYALRSVHAEEEAICILDDGSEPASEVMAAADALLADIGAEA